MLSHDISLSAHGAARRRACRLRHGGTGQSADRSIDSPILNELNRNDRAIVAHEGTAVPAWLIGDKARNGFDPVVLRAVIAKARMS